MTEKIMKMLKSLILLVLLCISGTAISSSQVKQFSLLIDHKDGSQSNCTLSVLNLSANKNSPDLKAVTTSHCFQDIEVDSIKVVIPKKDSLPDALGDAKSANDSQFFFGANQEKKISIDLKQIDSNLDLAELIIPTELEELFFSSNVPEALNPISKESLEGSEKCYSASGFAKEFHSESISSKVWYNSKTSFSSEQFNNRFFKHEQEVQLVNSWLAGTSKVLRFDDLHVVPGISGGAITSCNNEFLGIATRHKNGIDQVFAIGPDDVLKFLSKETIFFKADDNKEYIPLKGTRPIKGGGNSGGNRNDCGGNSGGNCLDDDKPERGGGNSGGNLILDLDNGSSGNDIKANANETDGVQYSPLESFIELNEGVKVTLTNSEKIVLAVNGHQIDNPNEYIPLGEHIFRNEDGYPDLKYRNTIIDRMKGDYSFEDGMHKEYQENNDHVYGWVYEKEGQAINESEEVKSPTVNINDDELTLTIPKHLLTDQHDGQVDSKLYISEKKIINFDISHNVDHTQYTLTNKADGSKMNCKNNNFLKFICKSDTHSFSISLKTSNGQTGTRFRYIEKKNDKLNFFYGEKE
jgi:hypothetical protein